MFMTLDESTSDLFVEQQNRLGNDVRWDGWEIVVFHPDHQAFSKPHGRFHNGSWGYEVRYGVLDDGTWKVSLKDVKTPRRTRN